MTKNLVEKRPIAYKYLTSNLSNDATPNLIAYFESEIAEGSVNGLPAFINVRFIKNNNMNLTKENGLLNLIIPIVPACYDINSTRSLSDFIANAKSPKVSADKTKYELDNEVFEKRIKSYSNKIMIYIKNELALRYAIAKENNDSKTMNFIRNLDVMKNVDLELYSYLVKQPAKIVESKIDAKNSDYILEYENGTTKKISKTQYRLVGSYFRFMQDYGRAQKKMFALTKALRDYETYDINHQKHSSTVPEHSIIARGVSRTNNRVTKPKKITNENKKQSQPGEE